MKVQTSMQYRQRLQRVIDYIYQHLSEDLTLEQLAEQTTAPQSGRLCWDTA